MTKPNLDGLGFFYCDNKATASYKFHLASTQHIKKALLRSPQQCLINLPTNKQNNH